MKSNNSASKSIKPDELAILKKCFELARKIETEQRHNSTHIAYHKTEIKTEFNEKDLFTLAALLKTLEHSENLAVQKLADIPEHFFSEMNLKHFTNFIIPIERALGRELRDDQIIVLDSDRATTDHQRAPMMFVLENIRSAFNVGSIFRLADCLYIEKIHLCGYTPSPEQEALQKTALGAANIVPYQTHDNLLAAIDYLNNLKLNSVQHQNLQLIALETVVGAKSLYQIELNKPTAFIVGNERFGLEPEILKHCDGITSIPTFGVKNSLNVAMALSIASYEWQRQQTKRTSS